MRIRLLAFCLLGVACASPVCGQSGRDGGKHLREPKITAPRQLTLTSVVPVPSEVLTSFRQPLVCDEKGNLYLETDEFGVSGIHKISPKGELLAAFRSGSNPDFRAIDLSASFSVSAGGELHELVFPHDQIAKYVVVYGSDGAFKTSVKLQPGFTWLPSALAILSNGALLITGQRYDNDVAHGMMWPFTGVFSSNGVLLKEVELEDDGRLRDNAVAGDVRLTSSLNPISNRAVSLSRMEVGEDGNAYLMRSATPAIFYVVSAGGEVERHFMVDPGDGAYRPIAMHVSGGRIAVLFDEPQTHEKLLKIVDVERRDLAIYSGDAVYSNDSKANAEQKQPLGGAFACYTAKPERFIFLGAGADEKLEIRTAEAR